MSLLYAHDLTFIRRRHESRHTGWQRPIGCLNLQIFFRKRATNHRALQRKMTYEDKASCKSTPLCTPHIETLAQLRVRGLFSKIPARPVVWIHTRTHQHAHTHACTHGHVCTHITPVKPFCPRYFSNENVEFILFHLRHLFCNILTAFMFFFTFCIDASVCVRVTESRK